MKKIRFLPYGYTIKSGETVIDRNEATVIKYIFEEYIKGSSLKDIASDLTQKHVPYTEKSVVWDKSRISRIIDNSKYIGQDEYDPIIDENTYENATAMKAARQSQKAEAEIEGIKILRNKVKCEKCGYPMVRKICNKSKIKESWKCTNEECNCRVRISDGNLILKVNALLNRIIKNSELLIPKAKERLDRSPKAIELEKEIDKEIENDYRSEEFILRKIKELSAQMYKESKDKELIAAQIMRERVRYMTPQQNFNSDYFNEIASYITLNQEGTVKLYTKADVEIEGGNEINDHGDENS